MIGPTLEIDLGRAAASAQRPDGATDVYLLVLHGGEPVAWIPVPLAPATIDRHFVLRLMTPAQVAQLAARAAPDPLPASAPEVTVAVCTRDRPAALRRCLASVARLDPAPAQVLVIDSASRNGPDDESVADIASEWSICRYVRVEEPGLSIARNRALLEARTAWVAFTDDDVELPAGWVGAVAAAAADGSADCITGPVVPAAVPGRAAELFEEYGGLNRGFERRTWDATFLRRGITSPPTWRLGAGANMAVDRLRGLEVGGFDPRLGAGKPAGCSEDTDLFYRLLRAGGRVRYTSRNWLMHHHREDVSALRRQLRAYGRGHAAAQWKACLCYGDLRGLGRLLFGLPFSNLRRVVRRLVGRSSFPCGLIVTEALGQLTGPFLWRPSQPSAGRRSAGN